jgi:alpha-L-fucosidase 2
MLHKFVYAAVLLSMLEVRAQDEMLWYRQPAQKWTEALPIGNGRLGAMVFGGVEEERLQFNESTLWSGRPRVFAREDAADYLGTIRKLLAEGRAAGERSAEGSAAGERRAEGSAAGRKVAEAKQAEAEQLAEKHFMGLKDEDEKDYVPAKEAWFKKVRLDTGFARADLDDRSWKEMTIPTPDGWEAAGLQGLDGAVWFRVSFDLPAAWQGKDIVLDLGRIRDMDFTYVNGVRVGNGEGISKKRSYKIAGPLLRATNNVMAIQVINFDDKGGLTGYKGSEPISVRLAEADNRVVALPVKWRYKIQDEEAPLLPKYEADYQPFGDLYIRFARGGERASGLQGQDSVRDYRRQLDIGTAISTVSFAAGGARYTREYFASAPQQVLVSHIKADRPGAINLEASLVTPHRLFVLRRVDDHTLALSLKVRNGVLRGVSYLRVQTVHGKVTVTGDKIVVRGADDVVFYLAAATSFVDYKDVSGDPEARCRAVIGALPPQGYAAIRAAHIREYQHYFKTFTVNFGSSSGAGLPTDQRIVSFSPEKDPALLALYMQYGRYLLISSSRPSSPLPANLQGIWNDLLSPPWGSKFTTNINLEMNYWPAEVMNLSPCSQPLFRLVSDLAVAGSLTAKRNYHAGGWVLHHNTDLWRASAPINASDHGIWVTGGAWLCHQVWEHYCFTKDRAFLQRYYPVMRDAAAFFVDFLVKDTSTGWLISTPSNSPEHGGLVAGPAMDHQIIRDLFRNCIEAARVLRLYPEFAELLLAKYRQIAPNQIGKYGQLQEWLEDKDDKSDTHRHISHLWGVYPGTDITWKDTAMMKAARQSLLYRGDDGTGWSLAWKVNCWARFRDGDHALRLVDKLLSDAAGTQGGERGGVYPNLFDAHPPFQIDGNFGGAAGITELLLQSQDSVIDILPALPAALRDGGVKGICARGGFVLDLQWQGGVLQRVKLLSGAGGECMLRYADKTLKMGTQKGKTYTFDGQLKSL